MTDGAREQAWAVFIYEWWMFTSMQRLLMSGVLGDGALRNAVVESSLLHLRILLEMILKKPGDDKKTIDDIGLADLGASVSDTDVETLRKAADPHRADLNKHLAHASKRRTGGRNYQPMIDTLRPLLETVVQGIMDSASPHDRKEGAA